MLPYPITVAFDDFLASQNLTLQAVLIGGSALALLGVVDRPTRDFDILHPELSPEILQAARDFASIMQRQGIDLDKDWLNNGPAQLGDVLPPGWISRTQHVFQGKALSLITLGRSDLLKSKLFALCDRGTDLQDCIALQPDALELKNAESWLIDQDAHPAWEQHVQDTLADLSNRLNHGI